MKIGSTKLTVALKEWLEDAGDPLNVRRVGADIDVTRPDGSELSEFEARRVRELLAAHAVEPLQTRDALERESDGIFVEIHPAVWEVFGQNHTALSEALHAAAVIAVAAKAAGKKAPETSATKRSSTKKGAKKKAAKKR